VTGGLWFVPSVIVLAAVLLALALVESGQLVELELAHRWPRVFGAAAEGARSMLSAIAGSMITVAGVVFSVTLVALSLAASQYSPRVLRTFMSDRPTQVVLGAFVGIFAYCLVVLRTIRGGEDGFVPSLAVLGGIVLAFVGIGLLVFFIHHLASSIEASSILQRVTSATLGAVEDLFPEDLGAPAEAQAVAATEVGGAWTPVAARASGYIISVDNEGLLGFARKSGRVVRMERGIGEFVIRAQPLASIGGSEAVDADAEGALNACFALDRQRTIEQDAAFGLQQIVDVAGKALSPGINDATTALMCIDRLTEILVRLARRRIESPFRRDDGRLRVIALGPSFESLVALAYRELRAEARGKRAVLARLLWSLEQLAGATSDPGRRRIVAAALHGISGDLPPQDSAAAQAQDRGDP
jgi:uncharacterized membrane protein